MLGPLELEADGALVAVPGGTARALLAQLLSRPNRAVSTQDLIDALWGDSPPRTSLNVLQAHIANLRRALRVAGIDVRDRLETQPRGYRMRIEPGELDADVFVTEFGEARRRQVDDPAGSSDLLREALRLWRGPAFADVDHDSLAGQAAAHLEEQRLDAVETLAEIDLRVGRIGEVIAELEPLVREQPFRERLHGLLMIALYRAGRQADALAAYRRVRSVLVEELGVEPGPELRALQLAVLRQDPALLGDLASRLDRGTAGDGVGTIVMAGPGDEHPRTTAAASNLPASNLPASNLPAAGAPFVGREDEVADLVERLARERLITVTGVGGAGKTRFAIRAAQTALDHFPDGVWFVDLTPVPDEDRVVSALVKSLGLTEQPGRDLLDTVVAAIADGGRLLVIDNCEHVVEACARIVDLLLRAGSGLTVLATSREPFRLASEVIWRLAPLSVPTGDRPVRADVLGADSVRLFIERAERARPGTRWDDEDLRTIGEICRRLDGLPLAIEMAAARLRVLAPQDVLDRLEDRFRLLADGERTAIPRHRTLRAAFDWSYDLLDGPEQRVLRRMSVFGTAVPPQAVDAVCGDGAGDDVVDVAMRLADRSLVVAELGSDGRARFGLLDTVREYGRVHLRTAGEESTFGRRHVDYWSDLAGRAYDRRLDQPDERADELERERGELLLALDRAHVLDPGPELRLAGALGWFWAAHAHISEGRRLLDRALAGDGDDEIDHARAMCARGAIASLQGEAVQASMDLSAGLAVWRRLDDRVEECATLDVLGWAKFWAGDDDESGRVFEDAVRLADEVGIPGLIRRTNAGLCQVLVAKSQVDRAIPLAQELLRIAGDDLRTAHLGHHFLADCALIGGDPERAGSGYRESLELAIRMGDAVETAIEIEGIAMATAGSGEPEEALYLMGAAEGALDALGVPIDVPFWNVLLERWIGPARAALGTGADDVRNRGRLLSLEDAARRAHGAPAQVEVVGAIA